MLKIELLGKEGKSTYSLSTAAGITNKLLQSSVKIDLGQSVYRILKGMLRKRGIQKLQRQYLCLPQVTRRLPWIRQNITI